MASVECGLRGHTTCTFGKAKRQTEDEAAEQRAIAIIIASFVVFFIFLCVAGVFLFRIIRERRKSPEVNNDIELGVVPQRDNSEPAVPQPIANSGRRRSISTAPPPYRTPSFEGVKDGPAADGMEHIEVSKK